MNQELKYKWVRHTTEWIKENPGKPTMYKHYEDGTIEMGSSKREKVPQKNRLPLTFLHITEEEYNRYDKPKAVKTVDRSNAGIYLIICHPVLHVYVGQSRNVEVRLRNHKMMLSKQQDRVSSATYDTMWQHSDEYGLSEFEFKCYRKMPGATRDELLKAEAETMWEFLRAGYKLYNSQLNAQFSGEFVSCPEIYQSTISKTILSLMEGRIVEEDLLKFVSANS